MKTQFKKLRLMSVIIAGFINANYVQANDLDKLGTLNYDNCAYVHAIHDAPNPVNDKKVEFAKITYVDKAYGQAIYSYPSNIAFHEVDFNIGYVDTAYGQAIYSYPNNNSVQHHLELSAETQSLTENLIVPVALTTSYIPSTTVNR